MSDIFVLKYSFSEILITRYTKFFFAKKAQKIVRVTNYGRSVRRTVATLAKKTKPKNVLREKGGCHSWKDRKNSESHTKKRQKSFANVWYFCLEIPALGNLDNALHEIILREKAQKIVQEA